jgi:hypothetical protein
MFSIDWLGLTADVIIDCAVETVVVVDPSGRVVDMEAIDIEVEKIDLLPFVLHNFGHVGLERMLDWRKVMLAKEEFEDALDEFEERHHV